MERYISTVIALVVLWLAFGAWRLRKKRATPGPAAAAMMNDLLSEDRRAAVEIILEDRTAERDPEARDGNLPQLARSDSGR